MVKLNWPKNSSHIRVFIRVNMCHYNNQICLKKIPTFMFYPGFFKRGFTVAESKSKRSYFISKISPSWCQDFAMRLSWQSADDFETIPITSFIEHISNRYIFSICLNIFSICLLWYGWLVLHPLAELHRLYLGADIGILYCRNLKLILGKKIILYWKN